jgi:hypothetical protein
MRDAIRRVGAQPLADHATQREAAEGKLTDVEGVGER